jgi:hypothetical protein
MAKKLGPYAEFLLELPIPVTMEEAKAAVATAENATQCPRCLHWAVYDSTAMYGQKERLERIKADTLEPCPHCGFELHFNPGSK